MIDPFYGRRADANVTGQLIENQARRQDWLELVLALQEASETKGGPLEGWVFHGTDGRAADVIAEHGLAASTSVVSLQPDEWQETPGVHFASANVAAFFAEDRIESLASPGIELALFGVPLATLDQLGTLAPDGQMLDCPIYSRIKMQETTALVLWENSPKDWTTFLNIFESVIVLEDVPAKHLVQFRHADDLSQFLEKMTTPLLSPKSFKP